MEAPNRTILVVDDDASIRFLCRVNLELEGWNVREASSLADAREALADEGVSVMLLDVHLGDGSGTEFLHEVKRERPELPVAMLTGSSPRAEDLAADAVIAKPFTLDGLSGTVRKLAG